MNAVELNTNALPPAYLPALSEKSAGSRAAASEPTDDIVQISPAGLREAALTGRIAAKEADGALTTVQAQQLYGQVELLGTQFTADRQADGGTLSPSDAQAIHHSQNELSGAIYTEAHNGAPLPPGTTVTEASSREAVQAGRIVLNEKAGNLSGDQAAKLGSKLGTIEQEIATDEQANGGTLSAADAQAIHQQQGQLSQQIYHTAHPGSVPAQ